MRLKTYLKGLGLGIFVTALIMSLTSKEAKSEMTDAEIIKRASELGMVSENAMLLKEAQALADNAADAAKKNTENTAAMVSANSSAVSGNSNDSKAAVSVNGQISGNKTVSSNGEIVDVNPKPDAMKTVSADKATEKEDKAATAGAQAGQSTPSQTAISPAALPTTGNESVTAENENETGEPEVVIINVSSGDSSVSVATKMVQAGLIDDARQFDSYLVLSGYDRRLVVGPHPIPKGATAAEMGAILTSKQ